MSQTAMLARLHGLLTVARVKDTATEVQSCQMMTTLFALIGLFEFHVAFESAASGTFTCWQSCHTAERLEHTVCASRRKITAVSDDET